MNVHTDKLARLSPGLSEGCFKRISVRGFGDPYNAYPHSMVWYRDHLYVGTSRNNFVMVKVTVDDGVRLANLAVWPVYKPDNLQDIMKTLRAEIWRYDPTDESWSQVFRSPLVQAPSGIEVPSCVSFRTMATFQGASDSEPVLYVPTRPTSHTPESVMLRSINGTDFEVISEPGYGLDPKPKGIRALMPFRDRLFAAPAEGPARGRGNIAAVMLVLASSDPAVGKWDLACEPDFGDPTNKTVFALAPFNGFLYAGTVNIGQGYQVWKTDAEGKPPYRWHKVVTHGAYRGRLNQIAMTMCALGDHLYVGSAIQGFRDHENDVGPAPPELIRIHRDDSWDLVAGEPRQTPDGLKVPLSGLGPGFGSHSAGYIWQMKEHDGWLYVGNSVWTTLLRYANTELWPDDFREMFTPDVVERIVRSRGGFDLWRTRDGVDWTPVTLNGFGNYYNIGCRTMQSTKHGLFVGAVNPFGPEVAIKRTGGWQYEKNPAAGLEIWLGKHSPPSTDRLPPAEKLSSLDAPGFTPAWNKHEDPKAAFVRQFFGDSGFRLCGYWNGDVTDAAGACGNLMEEVLSMLPVKQGRVLDLECGLGGSTRYLLRYFEPTSVIGVTSRSEDMQELRRKAPDVQFFRMKPVHLAFPPDSFESIVCMEGAGIRRKRERLWSQILRVLKPGGYVIGSDLLLEGEELGKRFARGQSGHAGEDTVSQLRDWLTEMGFQEVRVIDATFPCWTMFQIHKDRFVASARLQHELWTRILDKIEAQLPGGNKRVSKYVLISARKAPRTEVPTGGQSC
ncbi:MAG: class I SAM-dependent methyltransferase [Planctomycetota bacterium]